MKTMRPMPPTLLAASLGGFLILVSVPEPALDFLPGEPVQVFKTKTGVVDAYSWRGSFFDELPSIQKEMQSHGYQVRTTLAPSRCCAIFTREDGAKVKVSVGRWIGGQQARGLDPFQHEYVSAEVEDSSSLKHWWARLKSQLPRF